MPLFFVQQAKGLEKACREVSQAFYDVEVKPSNLKECHQARIQSRRKGNQLEADRKKAEAMWLKVQKIENSRETLLNELDCLVWEHGKNVSGKVKELQQDMKELKEKAVETQESLKKLNNLQIELQEKNNKQSQEIAALEKK